MRRQRRVVSVAAEEPRLGATGYASLDAEYTVVLSWMSAYLEQNRFTPPKRSKTYEEDLRITSGRCGCHGYRRLFQEFWKFSASVQSAGRAERAVFGHVHPSKRHTGTGGKQREPRFGRNAIHTQLSRFPQLRS